MKFEFDSEKLNTVYKLDIVDAEQKKKLFPFGIYCFESCDQKLERVFIVGLKSEDHNYWVFYNSEEDQNDLNSYYIITKIRPHTKLLIREFFSDYHSSYEEKVVTVNEDSTIDNPNNKLIIIVDLYEDESDTILNDIYDSLGE